MCWKGNNPGFKKWAALLAACFLFVGYQAPDGLPERLRKKLEAAVEGAFESADCSISLLAVPGTLNKETPVALGGENLFEIRSGTQLLGYAYLGEAPSMKNVFDYVVLLGPDLRLLKTKVLIYRENHGRQIGSQRWLKQFIGLLPGEQPEYGSDVDAISGATISAKSMTRAIAQVMQSVEILSRAGYFDSPEG